MIRPTNLTLILTALLLLVQGVAHAQGAGDPARGAHLFMQCQACHARHAGVLAGVGPAMAGIYGRPAAREPDYMYSPALRAAGIVWTDQALDRWLTKPTAMVPGTRMAFAGIADASARADIIAFLQNLK